MTVGVIVVTSHCARHRQHRASRVRSTAALVAISLATAFGCSDDDDSADDSVVASAPGTTAVATTVAPIDTAAPESSAAPETSAEPDTTAPDTSAEPATTVPAPTEAPEDEIDPEGTLHGTYFTALTTLDPHLETNGGLRVYWRPAYDTLFEAGQSGPEPSVVSDASVSDDGLTVTLEVRDDILFADGTPLDAAAVKANLDRVRTAGAPIVMGSLAGVTSVDVVDDSTVQISLSQPYPPLFGLLAGPAGAVINPTALANPEQLVTQTFGSGPYQSVEMVPNSHVVFEPTPVDYWRDDMGLLAELTISFVTDLQTNLNGLLSDAYSAPWVIGAIDQIESAIGDDFAVHTHVSENAETIFLRGGHQMLGDVRVRQALNLSVDRELIVEGIYQGDCTVTSQSFPEGSPLHLDEDPYEFDLERAQALMTEAAADGMPMQLVDNGNTTQHNLNAALQQQWAAIGINVELLSDPEGSAQKFGEGQYDAYTSAFAIQAHPLLAIARYYLPGNFFHLADGESADLEALVTTISDPTTSDADVAASYQELARAVAEKSFVVPICRANHHILTPPNVIGLDDYMPFSQPDYRRAAILAD